MNAVTSMQHGTFLNTTPLPSTENFDINVETEVEIGGLQGGLSISDVCHVLTPHGPVYPLYAAERPELSLGHGAVPLGRASLKNRVTLCRNTARSGDSSL